MQRHVLCDQKMFHVPAKTVVRQVLPTPKIETVMCDSVQDKTAIPGRVQGEVVYDKNAH